MACVPERRTIAVATPSGGWPPPWPQLAEIEAVLPRVHWTLIGGLMVQLHAIANGLGTVRPTRDVDMIVHIETRRGRPGKVAATLQRLGYELRPSARPRVKSAHRFVRNQDVVDVVAADHAAPRVREQMRGYDMVHVAGGTQALRRTINAELQILDNRTTTISVPDEFGALILKAAAHRNDHRDSDRHLADAAVLLACIADPFEARTMSGSDRARLRHLRGCLADPLNPVWLRLSEQPRRNAQTALAVLAGGPTPRQPTTPSPAVALDSEPKSTTRPPGRR
jgi:hypothetical protein